SYLGSSILSQGYSIFRTVEERQKPDKEREPSYQDRNLPYIKQNIQLAERGYDLQTDRAFFKYRLKKLFDIPQDQVPEALKDLIAKKSDQAVDSFVDSLYDGTILVDAEKRLELLEYTPDELKGLNDPMINLAAGLEKEMKILREKGKSLGQEQLDLKKIYLEALLEKSNGRIAPDANSTIRFTYGFIKGYKPRDAVYYSPQTTLSGVIEKETGEFPFHVPDKLKTLYNERDYGRYVDKKFNDIPVCFLNTTSITGGNSGSPTLNAKGEQTGIIFDMTYESVISDYHIVPELQRSISVDIRCVLFITEKFSGATKVLKELGF
ncbi:MAG: S46 family peptidase, partial [Candidatus Aminicenantes bacterium]|nr:S46 family peptidase [Candidatus Aminicenantes bacterium]